MKKLLIASMNQGKIKELASFLSDLPIALISLPDLGIKDEVAETENTYQKNSQKKARFYAKKTGFPAIADDGGIEIDALKGEPGIKSRRWLGYEARDEEIINHMKTVAKKLPYSNRKAYFRAVISFALPDGKVWSREGKIEGIVPEKPYLKLLRGYPYRSFFYLPKIGKYYHENELTEDEQKLYNHRYKAIRKLKPIIIKTLGLKE